MNPIDSRVLDSAAETGTSVQEQEARKAAYDRVCESYHAIDDFRMKLLGLLPVATGTGVFLLLNSNADLLGTGNTTDKQDALELFLRAAGLIGLTFTIGLFAYELFGIKRCHFLIQTGRSLENVLKVRGQFRNRPPNLMGFINEPFAAALIYPASMAAWIFLAVAYNASILRWALPLAVFLAGAIITLGVAKFIRRNDQRPFFQEIREAVNRHQTMTVAQIARLVDAEEEAIRQALAASVASSRDNHGGWFKGLRLSAASHVCLRRKEKPVTVCADEPVDQALATIKEHQAWVAITKENRIIGTVGKTDLIGADPEARDGHQLNASSEDDLTNKVCEKRVEDVFLAAVERLNPAAATDRPEPRRMPWRSLRIYPR